MHWHSIHVYYYDDDKDDLILSAVRPLLDRVSDQVDAAYYLRHWRLGPHLRLNFRCTPSAFTDSVGLTAQEIIGGYLSRRPSTASLDPQRLLPLHQRLAELEEDPGPLQPWHPDNSLSVQPYESRQHVLGGEEAAAMLADFYSDSTGLALRMTEAGTTAARRLALAFNLMISTAHALSGIGIVRGFLSFRSHAEAFLAAWPEGQGLRPVWDRHYHHSAQALTARVRAVVSTLDGDRDDVGFVRDWVAALRPYRSRANALVSAGRLSMDPPNSPENLRRQADFVARSDFHRLLLDHPVWPEIASAAWFNVYRVMLNYTYLHLTRLGLTPVERFLLCHLAANAVEDCYGISATELISGDSATALIGAAP